MARLEVLVARRDLAGWPLPRPGGMGVQVWPLQEVDGPLLSYEGYAESIAFSPDGRVLAAHGNPQGALALWSIPEAKLLPGGWGGSCGSNEGRAYPTGGMAFHLSGTLLATSFGVLGDRGYYWTISLWETTTGMGSGALRAADLSIQPTYLRFSPDGSFLAAACGPILRVWEIERGVEVASLKVGLKHFKALTFTPDGRRLLTVSNDETVRVWDSSDWFESVAYSWKIGRLGAVAVSPDGCRFAAGGSTGKVVIWDED